MKIAPTLQTIIKSFFSGQENNKSFSQEKDHSCLNTKPDQSSISKESKDIHSLSNALISFEDNSGIQKSYSKLLRTFDQKGEGSRFINLCNHIDKSGPKNHIRSFELVSKLDKQGLQSYLWFQNMEAMDNEQIDQYLEQSEKIFQLDDGHETKNTLINTFILTTSQLAQNSNDFDQKDVLDNFLKGMGVFEGSLDKMDYISLFFRANQ